MLLQLSLFSYIFICRLTSLSLSPRALLIDDALQPQGLTDVLSIMEPLTPTTSFADTSDAISENEADIASRWWEAKAQRTLESTSSIKDIQLICKYVPFDNPNAASLALSKQWRPQLETLWLSAHVKYNIRGSPRSKVHERSGSQVAESIVRLLLAGQKISTLPLSRHRWTPPSLDSSVSAETIAGSLDDHFCFLFLHLCSRDWTKAALGYHTTAVTSLLGECLDTRTALYHWYEQNTLPTNTWESVEEVSSLGLLSVMEMLILL